MSDTIGTLAPGGELTTRVIRATPEIVTSYPVVIDDRSRLDLSCVHEYGEPHSRLVESVRQWRAQNAKHLERGLRRALLADQHGIPTHFGALFASKITAAGDVLDLGLVSLRVITTTGVAAIADAFAGTVEPETFNFHGMGTGTNAEAVGDTALQTELTTQYNPDNTRATGTQTSPSNVYQTVGTNTIDSGTPAVTEHGILSQAATGGGTLLDRSVFSAINLAASDGIQFTYQLTFTSGG